MIYDVLLHPLFVSPIDFSVLEVLPLWAHNGVKSPVDNINKQKSSSPSISEVDQCESETEFDFRDPYSSSF